MNRFLALIFIMLVAISISKSLGNDSIARVLPFVLAGIIVLVDIYTRLTNRDNTHKMLIKFAHDNGLSYSKADVMNLSLSPSNIKSDAVSGVLSEHNYSFSILNLGQNKILDLVVDLSNVYPNIYIVDAKLFILEEEKWNIYLKNKIRISLEGNFDKYFTVYSTASRVEVLQILAPDLMARLIDHGENCSIYIEGNKLKVTRRVAFISETEVAQLFNLTKEVLIDIGLGSNNSRVKFDQR